MQPLGKPSGRKPIRRRARILQKEKEISDRATKIIDRFLRKVGELVDSPSIKFKNPECVLITCLARQLR